jgi:hypothetical protein
LFLFVFIGFHWFAFVFLHVFVFSPSVLLDPSSKRERETNKDGRQCSAPGRVTGGKAYLKKNKEQKQRIGKRGSKRVCRRGRRRVSQRVVGELVGQLVAELIRVSRRVCTLLTSDAGILPILSHVLYVTYVISICFYDGIVTQMSFCMYGFPCDLHTTITCA